MKVILVIGLISATIYIHDGTASMIEGCLNDKEIENRIIKKAQKENSDVRSLTEDEKEWIYKTDLLQDLNILKAQYKKNVNTVDYEDLSRTALKIAQFELDKDHKKAARKWFKEAGRWFLEAALRGSGNHLAFLSSLAKDGQLDKATSKKIEDEAADEDSSPETHSYLIKGNFLKNKEFINLRNILAKALEDSGDKPEKSPLSKKRKPFVSEKAVAYIFQEKYKKQKSEE